MLNPEAVEFGAALREMRISQGNELSDVARLLRIRQVFLQAIEDGRFQDLPGPTYASGFVRAYADFLGLDVPEVMRRYRDVTGPGSGMTQGALVPPSPVVEGRTPTGSILLVGAVLAAIAYGGWYYLTLHGRDAGEMVSGLPKKIAEMVGLNQNAVVQPTEPPAQEAPESVRAKVPALPPETVAEPAPAPAEAESKPSQEPEPEPAAPATAPAPEPAASTSPAQSEPAAADVSSELKPTPVVYAPLPVPRPKLVPKAAAAPPPEPANETTARDTTVAAEPAAPTPETAAAAAAPAAQATPEAVPPKPAAAPPAAESAPMEPASAGTAPLAMPEASAASMTADAAPAAKTEPTPPAAETLPTAAAAEPTPAAPPVETPPADIPAADAAMPAAPQVAAAPPAAGGGGRVILRAAAASWVELRGPDNRRVFSRLMRAGETYSVPPGKAVTLTTGNAGGLDILIDGKAVPALGPVGAVRRDISLDPESLLARLQR